MVAGTRPQEINKIEAQREAARVAAARFGSDARKAGHITVSIDDDGNLIEIAPDGTRQQLAT